MSLTMGGTLASELKAGPGSGAWSFRKRDRWLLRPGDVHWRLSVSGFFQRTGLLETTIPLMSVAPNVIMEINKVAQGPGAVERGGESADGTCPAPTPARGDAAHTGFPRTSHVMPAHMGSSQAGQTPCWPRTRDGRQRPAAWDERGPNSPLLLPLETHIADESRCLQETEMLLIEFSKVDGGF